jgi:hypothetical protein
MRAAVVGLLGDGANGSPAAPDGVRLQAVRFAEQAVLLCTAAAKPPPPPGAASLAGAQAQQDCSGNFYASCMQPHACHARL